MRSAGSSHISYSRLPYLPSNYLEVSVLRYLLRFYLVDMGYDVGFALHVDQQWLIEEAFRRLENLHRKAFLSYDV